MRLIDADALIEAHYDYCNTHHGEADCFYTWSLQLMENAPTIEAEPVRHGRWIKMSDADEVYWACSECGEDIPRISHYNPQFDLFPRLESIDKTNYCPNCGAKMENKE